VNNDMNTLDVRTQEGLSLKEQSKQGLEELLREQEREAEMEAVQFAQALAKEIGDGAIEVETEGSKIIIRVKERGSFDSGSAQLKFDYIPIIEKIRDLLLGISGTVAVEGHSDNIPYNGTRFESNWDLSAARALAVAHELFADPRIEPGRFTVSGKADSRPLVPNDSPENRATNRRVEIVIQKGEDQEELQRIQATESGQAPAGLAPEEIF